MELTKIILPYVLTMLVAAVTTLATIFFKGVWDEKISKKKSREALVRSWRMELFEGDIFLNEDGTQRKMFVGRPENTIMTSKSWPTLKSHLSKKTLDRLMAKKASEDSHPNTINMFVGNGNNHLKELLIDEINKLERKWSLI
jgi:hypothetical protein